MIRTGFFLTSKALAIFCATLGFSNLGEAAEGGSGVYALGYISPQAGLMPVAGTYVGLNYYAYQGESSTAISTGIPSKIPGTHLQFNATAKTEVNSSSALLTLTHVYAEKLLGGQLGVAMLLPYAKADLDLKGNGTLTLNGPFGGIHNRTVSGRESESASDIGDMTLSGLLGWHDGRWHSMAMLNIYAPTGGYDKHRLINIGRNHWAIEPMLGTTYLNESSGLEVSGAAGVTFNQENTATHYKTGNEFHLDLSVIQHFSERFYAGLAGYAYRQLTGDSGSGASTAYKGQVFGIGPIIGGTIALGQNQQLFINVRYYKESAVENRLKGDTFFLTGSLKF